MEYFADTTIAYDLIFKPDSQRDTNTYLCDYFSSTYVLKEYKFLIKVAVDFHTKLINNKNLKNSFFELSKMYKSNKFSDKIFLILSKFINEDDEQISFDEILYKLEYFISDWCEQLFFNVIHKENLYNETRCKLSDLKFEKIPGTNIFKNESFYCRKKDNICDLEDFINKHIDEIKSISLKLVENKKILKKHEKENEILIEILKDYRNGKGKNCSKIGDIIIALESPKKYTIISTDHFFEFLGEILNKKTEIKKYI